MSTGVKATAMDSMLHCGEDKLVGTCEYRGEEERNRMVCSGLHTYLIGIAQDAEEAVLAYA